MDTGQCVHCFSFYGRSWAQEKHLKYVCSAWSMDRRLSWMVQTLVSGHRPLKMDKIKVEGKEIYQRRRYERERPRDLLPTGTSSIVSRRPKSMQKELMMWMRNKLCQSQSSDPPPAHGANQVSENVSIITTMIMMSGEWYFTCRSTDKTWQRSCNSTNGITPIPELEKQKAVLGFAICAIQKAWLCVAQSLLNSQDNIWLWGNGKSFLAVLMLSSRQLKLVATSLRPSCSFWKAKKPEADLMAEMFKWL